MNSESVREQAPTPARAGGGDRREPIFRDHADRQRFVETLAEVCAKTGLAP